MQRQMLKSKIHRASVTTCDVDSISIDPELMRAADLLPNEQVASFAAYDERDIESYVPVVVHVSDRNEVLEVDSHPEVLLGSSLASDAEVAA